MLNSSAMSFKAKMSYLLFTRYRVSQLMKKHDDSGHGMPHIDAVLLHGIRAFSEEIESFIPSQVDDGLLACLLHDVDDRKLFETENYANARLILQEIEHGKPDKVIELIDLVSASKNQNKVVDEKWKLIPRDCDRLEAIGIIGIKRCYQYTLTAKMPLFTPETPRPKTVEELYKIATPERFANYKGNSASMIDHYFDKLLHVNFMASGNSYLVQEAKARSKIMEDFVLSFGKTGTLDIAWLNSL